MRGALVTALPAMLIVTACGGAAPADGAGADGDAADHSAHTAAMARADLTEAQKAYAEVNDRMHAAMADIPENPDIAFMQGMLAHHRGAVAMSQVALKHADDPQTRDLAQRVIDAQETEIAEMEVWLKARGAL